MTPWQSTIIPQHIKTQGAKNEEKNQV